MERSQNFQNQQGNDSNKSENQFNNERENINISKKLTLIDNGGDDNNPPHFNINMQLTNSNVNFLKFKMLNINNKFDKDKIAKNPESQKNVVFKGKEMNIEIVNNKLKESMSLFTPGAHNRRESECENLLLEPTINIVNQSFDDGTSYFHSSVSKKRTLKLDSNFDSSASEEDFERSQSLKEIQLKIPPLTPKKVISEDNIITQFKPFKSPNKRRTEMALKKVKFLDLKKIEENINESRRSSALSSKPNSAYGFDNRIEELDDEPIKFVRKSIPRRTIKDEKFEGINQSKIFIFF
jgi:hypothetical protein